MSRTETGLSRIPMLKLSPYVTVFEDSAFKKVIKVKRGDKGKVLTVKDLCSYQKTKCVCTEERPREKAAIRKPEGAASPETNPASSVIFNFQLPEL